MLFLSYYLVSVVVVLVLLVIAHRLGIGRCDSFSQAIATSVLWPFVLVVAAWCWFYAHVLVKSYRAIEAWWAKY